jgi:hypothetical protein
VTTVSTTKAKKAAALAELLKRARLAHASARGGLELARAMDAGDALLAAKAIVAHGAWTDRVAETGIPPSTAALYMQLARNKKRITAAGCSSIRQARELLADRVPPRRGTRTKTARRARTGKQSTSDRYAEGYEAGYRAGRADAFQATQTAHPSRPLADLPTDADMNWLLALAHPERHLDNDKGVLAATRVMQWLNRLREGHSNRMT